MTREVTIIIAVVQPAKLESLLTPKSEPNIEFLCTVSPMNQTLRLEKRGNDHQIKQLLIVKKFSLSTPQQIYRDQHGEYVCQG